MVRSEKWTRRQFSQAIAAAAGSSLLVRTPSASGEVSRESFAIIASPEENAIRVFRVTDNSRQQLHALPAAAPGHLLMHPTAPMLYVLHDVAEWEHRPRGAVSAYRFDRTAGHLEHMVTQPLSLSATHPRHAVVTDDGRALFVAAEAGGIYNVLPIAADGILQPVSAIRKEVGMEDGTRAKTAAPRKLLLRADGSVSAIDPGRETVSSFRVTSDGIVLRHRKRLDESAGTPHPGSLTLRVA